MSVAAFISSQRAEHGVPHATACRALGVSESWFYPSRGSIRVVVLQVGWSAEEPTAATPGGANRRDPGRVRRLRRHVWLSSDHRRAASTGWRVSKNTVAAVMAAEQLVARPTQRRRCLTRADKTARRAPDLLSRGFTAPAPDVKWCGDLTEIPTGDGKLYLATVENLFCRRLLGFAMSDRHDAELAVASVRMAAAVRGGTVTGVIFHTDQGSEYSSGLFGAACRSLGVTKSMGRVGSALDNAAAESFFSTLEHEVLSRRQFATRDEARQVVAGWIDGFYNRIRRHSTLGMRGMRSPVDYELAAATPATAA